MVAKQKLPGFVNWIIFINTLNLLSIRSTASSDYIQYCWSGTNDDPTQWKNQTCATNQLVLPNTIAKRSLPFETQSNQTSHVDTTVTPKKKFYCMAFQYNETYYDATGDKIEQFIVNYSCDLQNMCEGRDMHEGYKVYSDKLKREGHLFCCDSGDNCNTHKLVYKRIHQHTCYTGNSMTHSLSMDHCPHQKSHCMKIVDSKTTPESDEIETVREVYGCDINDKYCGNLTEAENHSCQEKRHKQGNETTTSRVCCCKADNCFKPSWVEGFVPRGVRNKQSLQNSWQRTMLIIIGVALGILVVGVAIFFVRKSVKESRKAESPKRQYDSTAYKSMTMENGIDTDDTVQILST